MSIYRKFDREPASDVHAKTVKHDAAVETRAPATQSQRAPSAELLALTVAWAAKLPPDIRPLALARAFPRIANAIAATWIEPESFLRYVDDLFVDRRGSRQGFPPEVMEELFALRAYFEELHPTAGTRWEGTAKRR